MNAFAMMCQGWTNPIKVRVASMPTATAFSDCTIIISRLGFTLSATTPPNRFKSIAGTAVGESNKPQLYGRARDVIDQPANGHDEHLKAHDGDHLAEPEDAIVPVLQRLKQAQP